MRLRKQIAGVFAGAALLVAPAIAQTPKKVEARITSIHPLTVQRGHATPVVIRGTNIVDATGLLFRTAGIQGKVVRVEPGNEKEQLVHAEVTADAKPGSHKFGLITATGLSNEIAIRVAAEPVAAESRNLAAVPAVVTGRLEESGEVDEFWMDAKAGDALMFEVFSGSDTLDPSVTLYEQSGSWFDPKRLNRVAWNDEPVWFPGYPKDARLTHRFERAGKYCVRVQGGPGQGGPDSVYELRVSPASTEESPLRPPQIANWEEREMTRPLTADWMQRVASRGAPPDVKPPTPETYRAVVEGTGEIPMMKLPGLVEGVIAAAGETHAIRINVEKAQELVIEVETPEATLPQFNPVVGLSEPGGTEIVGNIYTRLNNNNLKMMKSVKAKTAFSLNAPGIYTMRIHELTTDLAGKDFRYRVLVRPQIPHVGKFVVQQDRVNIARGNTRPVSVRVEREEGYAGLVAIQMENLPPGVTAMTGVENPPEIPALPNAGKPERYQPRTQMTSVLLAAASDAPTSPTPAVVKVLARPIRDGRLGDPIVAGEIALTVVEEK